MILRSASRTQLGFSRAVEGRDQRYFHSCSQLQTFATGNISPCLVSASSLMSAINDEMGLKTALEQAQKSYDQGGVPIGAALIYNGTDPAVPNVLGLGHNERIQKSSATLHGEISALDAAGRLKPAVYRSSTMVSCLQTVTACRRPLSKPHFFLLT